MKAAEWLKMVLLDSKKDTLAKNLAHGEKRKLEIAMLLALNTEVLLLDEPTAGMSLEEVPAILDVIRKIKETRGSNDSFDRTQDGYDFGFIRLRDGFIQWNIVSGWNT